MACCNRNCLFFELLLNIQCIDSTHCIIKQCYTRAAPRTPHRGKVVAVYVRTWLGTKSLGDSDGGTSFLPLNTQKENSSFSLTRHLVGHPQVPGIWARTFHSERNPQSSRILSPLPRKPSSQGVGGTIDSVLDF